MARIIKSSGSGPLYTGDSFSTVIDRNVKRTPGKSGIDKLGEALSIADKLAKSEVVGAVGGLISKGASKIGQAIEEAGMVSEAEKEKQAFEAERQGLIAQKEKEMATPTEEADVIQKEMTQKMDRNKFITELKTRLATVNRDTRTETLKFVGEAARRGLITPEESEKILMGIDKKTTTPVGKEVADALEKEISDLEYEASGERVKLEMLRDKGVETGVEYDDAVKRYKYLKDKADQKRRDRDAAVGGVAVEAPTEGSPVKEIIRRVKESGNVDKTLLALRARRNAGTLTREQRLVLEALEEDIDREPMVSEITGRETGPTKKPGLAGVKGKTQEQLRAEMEAASEDGEMIGSEEAIPMEPTGPMNLIDEQEKERQRKIQEEIDTARAAKFKSSRGVTYDERGMPIVKGGAEALTEEDLLSAARRATSPEEQSAVLAAIEEADITPKTLLDMATGAHKQRFADRVKGMFPKVKTLTPEERALYRARIAKLGEETKVIAPKAEADIESKKAGAALSRTRTDEVQQKVDALWKGINLPVSQIIKNLRKPSGGAGAAAAKRLALSAAARLADNERRRLAQEYDKDIEVDKQNISKVDSEINKLGPDEAMPSKPKIGSPDNVAKYEKEVARVKQANAKREQLRREKEVSVNAMNSKQTEKVAKIKDIDEAESEVIKRVIDLPDTKKKETKPVKPVTPASTTKPLSEEEKDKRLKEVFKTR